MREKMSGERERARVNSLVSPLLELNSVGTGDVKERPLQRSFFLDVQSFKLKHSIE